MDDIGSWLSTIAWPLVSRVMVAMGVGTVTYQGASSALSSALTAAKGAFMGLAAPILQLITMGGFFDYMAITSGGIMSGLAWLTLKHFALMTGSGTSGSGS